MDSARGERGRLWFSGLSSTPRARDGHARLEVWRWLAAALSAVLCVSATPPYDLWPAALVAWVPLLFAADGLSSGRALALGLTQGALINLLSLYWLVPALNEDAG